MTQRWLPLGLAILICLLAWFVFLYHLDYESMWYDERIAWVYSNLNVFQIVQNIVQDKSVHPPAYFFSLLGWRTFTQSQNLFVMRISSVIPAVLAVAVAYRLGADWFKNRWGGAGAAIVLATSGIFIYYARELRMYSLLVFLVLVSWWFFTRLVTTGRRSMVVAYAGVVTLMAYTYYFAAFSIAMQVVALLLFFRHRLREALLAYALVVVGLLPWLPTILKQIRAESAMGSETGIVGKVSASEPTTWQNIRQFVELYTANQQGYVILLIVLALGLALVLKQAPHIRRWVIISALWLLATPVFIFALNTQVRVYSPRYLLGIIPSLGLLGGFVVSRQPALGGRLLLIGAFAVIGLGSHTEGFRPLKTPHGELLGTVAAQHEPGDRIWYNLAIGAMGSSLWMEVQDYYLPLVYPELADTDMYIWDAPNDFADVAANPRIWDIRPYWIDMPGDVETILLDGRALLQETNIHGYTVRLYDAPPQDHDPTVFAETIALQTLPVDQSAAPGTAVDILSWWRALAPLDKDYSLGVYLRQADGKIVAQLDTGLLAGDTPTTQWQPGENYRPLQIPLVIPADLPAGVYEVWLAVYYWEDPQPLPISAAPDIFLTQTEPPLVQVGTITVTNEAE